VDLNRNMPTNWAPVDCAALPRNCAGPGALSEPESGTFATFVTAIRPELTIMYHGADHVVSAATATVAVPQAVLTYAGISGYALASIHCSPACTGTATQSTNAAVAPSTAFTVELSTKAAGGMSTTGVANHTAAFLAAAAVI